MPSQEALLELARQLQNDGIPHAVIREPDPPFFGEVVAIGIAPLPKSRVRRLMGSLPLIRYEASMGTLDIQKLKTDIQKAAMELREIKKVFRTSHQPDLTSYHHVRREVLKHRATLLCSIRAYHRGRIHLKGATLQSQAEFIGVAWKRYQRTEDAAA